jgi:UDP-4-amino-4-deoxy-L-arabinose formyltransferase/UDP-glucuronic acid dehydrogenase (UDP-4-keto-hexauronic acid decarboxylating)
MICSKNLIRKLVTTYMEKGEIPIRTDSKDYDSWYNKRTAADGKIDFKDRTRNIYNLIRGVAAPFPGAFCYADKEDDEHKVTIWEAHPFDEMMDFSGYAPGEIIDVFDNKPIVRTVDGSIRIDRYESEVTLTSKMLLI